MSIRTLVTEAAGEHSHLGDGEESMGTRSLATEVAA